MTYAIFFILLISLLCIWFALGYNTLVRLKVLLEEGWSGIDIQLKRRYDLIPNLVTTVKQYSLYEKDVLESITKARTRSIEAQSIQAKSEAETSLTSHLHALFAVVEKYPDLKANESYLSLQNQLSDLESEIQLARRYYNGTARNYNIQVQSFPSNIIASIMTFRSADYFQISESERNVVEVKLS